MNIKWGLHTRNGIQSMIGKVPVSISETGDEIVFCFSDGTAVKFCHEQDCCESVSIEDVNGDWDDLIGTPLLVADERSDWTDADWGDQQWTFYTFRSVKGSVDVRWYGESNGYYSTSVYMAEGEWTE